MDPKNTFIHRLGYTHRFDPETMTSTGACTPVPALFVPDTQRVRTSVLLTFADMVAGTLANRATEPRVCMTVDLNVRALGPQPEGPFTVAAQILKTGRNTTVCEVRFTSMSGGSDFALSHATFVASPRPEDLLDVSLDKVGRFAGEPLAAPFADDVGIRIVEPGITEIDRRQYVLNPSDTLQGGIVALLAEVAAESAPEAAGRLVADLDVRYLSAVRIGPGRATAEALDKSTVRVEVRDPGNNDRLAAIVIATLDAPLP